MRVLYPDLVFGAIASSGVWCLCLRLLTYGLFTKLGCSAVTHAALTNWEYMDVIRLAADPTCSSNLVKSIATVDQLLKVGYLRSPLKKLFGLGGLESDQDFVSVLAVCSLYLCFPRVISIDACLATGQYPLASWQDRNWDPALGSTTFDDFCVILNGDTSTMEDTARTVLLPGGLNVNIALLNYAKWIREVHIPLSKCLSSCPRPSLNSTRRMLSTSALRIWV
jgi:hypothetical protein